ncbi:MAG TPA: class I SAM-dependent methyltransferase [Pseudonocardia sp.]|jgi:SAM-dependent methyltransferase
MSGAAQPGSYDEAYYEFNGQIGDRPALGWYTRLVRRYVGPGPYLDFGCGTGHLLRRLSVAAARESGNGTGASAAGFEVSGFSAARARQTAPGCPVYTEMADLPDAHFGGLTAIHVLEHLEDSQVVAALATWRRTLRPGARALVVLPDPAGCARALTGDKWAGFSDPTHINLKSHAAWRELLEAEGFTVLREGSDGLWNVPYRKLPKIVDAALHAVPSLTQFLAGRLFLRPGSGESAVFVLELS